MRLSRASFVRNHVIEEKTIGDTGRTSINSQMLFRKYGGCICFLNVHLQKMDHFTMAVHTDGKPCSPDP
jgi:hypothetical protein